MTDLLAILTDYSYSMKTAILTRQGETNHGNSIFTIRDDSEEQWWGGYVVHEVEIGTQTWSDRNLDLTFDGLQFNISTNDAVPAAFYNSDAYKKGYGLLYNWSAAKYLNDNRNSLIPGWHVPSYQELLDLSTSLGGNSVAGGKLKDMACYGSNEYGFNMLMTGYFNSGFIDVNSSASIWSTDAYDNNNANYIYCLLNDSQVHPSRYYKYVGFSIRLVKDIT